jgi:protocatechuate 4,5-dioxygenase alpha chain
MSDEQKQAVMDRDLNRILALGGNIYFCAKIGAVDGLNYVQIVSSMTENNAEEHRQMMIAGGRSPEGNRDVSEWEDGGDPASRKGDS